MLSKYLFILIIFISSCNLTGEIYPYDWQIPIEINTKQEALDYVSTYNYEPKYGVFLPDEFYNSGYGDCEDFALMFQYILETQLNIKADLIGGEYNGIPHMWVESNGVIYEPTAGVINNNTELYNPIYRFEYPDSVYTVRMYGGFIN